MLGVFNGNLFNDKVISDRLVNVIRDPEMILKVLLQLANDGVNRYDLRKYVINYRSENDSDGYIWVIGDKCALDSMNVEKKCPQIYKNELTRLISLNNSLVVVTNYGYDWNIIPDTNNSSISRAKIKEFDTYGFISKICCYTYSDALNIAVDKLESYIKKYGGDTTNVSFDEIIRRVEEAYNNSDKNKPCEIKETFKNGEEKCFYDACQKYNYQNADSKERQKMLNRNGKRRNN